MAMARSFARDDAALLGILGALVGVLVAGSLGTAGYLYATDYGLKADVEQQHCSIPTVTVKTEMFGLHHDVGGITVDQCANLLPGDRVVYHVRTKHTTIYNAQGVCIYDTQTGYGCGAATTPTPPGGLLH
jgi:hypothetical protein